MLYPLLRPLLFGLDAETSHQLALQGLKNAHRLGLSCAFAPGAVPAAPRTIMGLSFPNPVGLAAGFDKDGACIDGLAALGFGFLEIGTVTPRPQPGNPRPRMFRIPEAQAIINRLGFNNHGVDALVANVKAAAYRGVLGINIGKNFDTPLEKAADDYLACLAKVYPLASYVTVNISSPNTQNLRDLQQAEPLEKLLAALQAARQALAELHGRKVPLLLKIAPDLPPEDIRRIADGLLAHQMDGIIATNTTVSREGVGHLAHGAETGGLSGTPLRRRATETIRQLHRVLGGAIPIIGAGGILSGADAQEKIQAGASLVQIYTGFVYRGPDLIREAAQALRVPSAAVRDTP